VKILKAYLRMQPGEQTNDAPPTTGSSTINIEGVEYTYAI
jgi:hypothetical protein